MGTLLRACFEDNSLSLFPITSGAAVVSTTGKDMKGDYCLSCENPTDYAQRTIPTGSVLFGAARVHVLSKDSSSSEDTQICGFFSDSTLLCNIAMDTDGYLVVYNGDSTILALSDYPIVENTTYLFEFYYALAANPSGNFQIKINSVTFLNFSGNTKTGSLATFTAFRVGYCGVESRNTGAYFDNIILSNSSWIGDTELQILDATTAGSISDEQSDGGSVFTFLHEDFTGDVLSIKGIQVQASAYNEDSSLLSSFNLVLNPILDSSEEIAYGDDNFELDSEEQVYVHNWDSHPNFLTPWTVEDINGTEIGYSEEDIS